MGSDVFESDGPSHTVQVRHFVVLYWVGLFVGLFVVFERQRVDKRTMGAMLIV